MLPDRRRRGKSVVFDDLPSLVTTSHDGTAASFLQRRRGSAFKKVPWRETVVLLSCLLGALFLVYKFHVHSVPPPIVYYGSKHVVEVQTPFIVPTALGGQNKNAARGGGVKKAPGDKQAGKPAAADSLAQRKIDTFYHFESPTGDSPRLVVVTLLDDKLPREHLEKIIENRREYCQAHGFGLLMKYQSEFAKFVDVSATKAPTWARTAFAIEAQFSFPLAEWFWYVEGTALIMDATRNVLTDLLEINALRQKIRPGRPVLRYRNSHIQTYYNGKAEDVSFVTFLDSVGVSTVSFCFRNTLAARTFMQVWGEPLYRTDTETPDEQLALGHMLQWHPQFLVRTGIVDAKNLAAFDEVTESNPKIASELDFNLGDFVVVMQCDMTTEPCRRDFQTKWTNRKRARARPEERDVKVARDEVQNQVQVEAQERAQEKAERQMHKEEEQ